MNSELKALGIQYKLPSGTWVLMDRYANMGYTRSNTFVYDEIGKADAAFIRYGHSSDVSLYMKSSKV